MTDETIYERQKAVATIEQMVQQMGLDHFYLAGNSLGGHVAWIYTYAHPERVDKLILIDSAGFYMKMPWILRFASSWPIRPFARHMMPRFMFDTAVEQVYGDPDRIAPGVKDRYFEMAMREGGKSDYVTIFQKLRYELGKPTVSDGISDITVPTLVMWGDKDIWIPYPEHPDKWRQALPNAQFKIYEGAGHVPMEEIPVQTARDALAFLLGNTTAAKAE